MKRQKVSLQEKNHAEATAAKNYYKLLEVARNLAQSDYGDFSADELESMFAAIEKDGIKLSLNIESKVLGFQLSRDLASGNWKRLGERLLPFEDGTVFSRQNPLMRCLTCDEKEKMATFFDLFTRIVIEAVAKEGAEGANRMHAVMLHLNAKLEEVDPVPLSDEVAKGLSVASAIVQTFVAIIPDELNIEYQLCIAEPNGSQQKCLNCITRASR
eukprot:3597638-Amphidinium_carterae.4